MTVLRCSFDDEVTAGCIADALGGAGAPAGVTHVERRGVALEIHFDPQRTPDAFVRAVIETELAGLPCGVPPAGDDALTARCAAVLREPQLDTSRLIETYVEPMLGST